VAAEKEEKFHHEGMSDNDDNFSAVSDEPDYGGDEKDVQQVNVVIRPEDMQMGMHKATDKIVI
jgi:hypothetical protein